MNEIDFINKWSPNGFENPYSNFCFKLDLKELKEHIRAEAIEEFVKWAYIHGIDFSFMGKIKEDGKSDVPQKLQNIKDRFYNELKEQKNEHI